MGVCRFFASRIFYCLFLYFLLRSFIMDAETYLITTFKSLWRYVHLSVLVNVNMCLMAVIFLLLFFKIKFDRQVQLEWKCIEFYWLLIHVHIDYYRFFYLLKIFLATLFHWPQYFISWRPADAMWHSGTLSSMVQAIACCLTAPNHYMNQCWFVIS